jgi:hypothetical protein
VAEALLFVDDRGAKCAVAVDDVEWTLDELKQVGAAGA